LPIF
ncbi:hypothetical protein EC960939_4294, partial [Escherichia coli 96.0939]